MDRVTSETDIKRAKNGRAKAGESGEARKRVEKERTTIVYLLFSRLGNNGNSDSCIDDLLEMVCLIY